MTIYAIKTTASQEQTVADMIATKELEGIQSCIAPDEMVSYLLVEAIASEPIERVVDDIPHATKILDSSTGMTEVEQFLEPPSDVKGVNTGDFVEITGGPYQGEKATITDVINGNEQVTVELYEATVPIPVTLGGKQIRVLDSEEREQL